MGHGRVRKTAAGWLPYGLLLAGCAAGGFLPQTAAAAQWWLVLGLAAVAVCAACLLLTRRLTASRAVWLLIVAGCVLRIGYVLYTGYDERQHDVWYLDSGKGHMGYIRYMADHLSLPDTNRVWQFYHPPLHHAIAGLLLRGLTSLGVPLTGAAERLQLLTAFYSCAALVVCARLLQALRIRPGGRCVAMAGLCFHPTFLLLAGSLNNDTLLVLFSCGTLLYLIRWWQDPSLKHSLLMAVCLGLSMMAKTSGVLLAPAIALAFLLKLYDCREQPVRPLVGRMCAFGAVSIPLGMWYPVRNLIRFGQPLFYVPGIADTDQYVGDVPAVDRLFLIPLEQLSSPYQDWTNGYNIPLSALKTSLFGERDLGGGVWAYLLLGAAAALGIWALAALLVSLIRRPDRGDRTNWLLLVAGGVTAFSYVVFCFAYPHICSQDFRYLTLLLPVGAAFLGRSFDRRKSKGARGALVALTGLFCLSSAAVYVHLAWI